MALKKYERWILRGPLLLLMLGACSTLPLDPADDEWVGQRIARHPEPWVIDAPRGSPGGYAHTNLEGHLFFLSEDSLANASSSSDMANAKRDCLAKGADGKKDFSLCFVRNAEGKPNPNALKLRPCPADLAALSVQKSQEPVQKMSMSTEEACNGFASGRKANFYSFDKHNDPNKSVCLAVTICAANKSTIERDRLIIELESNGPIGATVATGGPRPM